MKNTLRNQQNKLFQFVKKHHGKQVRKYTGEPYTEHLLRVANMASKIKYGFEIGLCHDLIEDTNCTYIELKNFLRSIGYNSEAIFNISEGVKALTDQFTKETQPHRNRQERKQLESRRLWGIAPDFQSVKYCDIIDNASSIKQLDPSFAKVYLSEKRYILMGMNKGLPLLYHKAMKVVE